MNHDDNFVGENNRIILFHYSFIPCLNAFKEREREKVKNTVLIRIYPLIEI